MSIGFTRTKNGPGRRYTDEQIAHFARFRQQREPLAPVQCDHGDVCWVLMGPPAISPSVQCLGCGGTPKPWGNRGKPALPPKYPGLGR